MPEPRTTYENEIVLALKSALPAGVRVEALSSQEQLKTQKWPAVFVTLAGIDYERQRVVGQPTQSSTWTWFILCFARRNHQAGETGAFQLADMVSSTLRGFRFSDGLAGPLRLVREDLQDLEYNVEVRSITLQHDRGMA